MGKAYTGLIDDGLNCILDEIEIDKINEEFREDLIDDVTKGKLIDRHVEGKSPKDYKIGIGILGVFFTTTKELNYIVEDSSDKIVNYILEKIVTRMHKACPHKTFKVISKDNPKKFDRTLWKKIKKEPKYSVGIFMSVLALLTSIITIIFN